MEQRSMRDKIQEYSTLLQFILLIIITLYIGKALFIPLGFALLISIILFPVSKWLESRGIGRGMAVAIPISVLFLGLGLLVFLLIKQLLDFSVQWSSLKENASHAIDDLSLFLTESLGLSLSHQMDMLQHMTDNAGNQVFNVLGSTASSFSNGFFFMIMIPIFSTLILYYRRKLTNALYHFFPAGNHASIKEVLLETIETYYNFIKGMALVYLIVGILNSIGLALIGVPHPVLFGCIAALLTFIPYIGILIASFLPITVAWVTYNSIWHPAAVVIVFAIVQTLEAYLIFPVAVGKKLKINTLVVFLMIVLGGLIWGAAGMILFIPMVSIFKLIADRSPRLKYLSELLGE